MFKGGRDSSFDRLEARSEHRQLGVAVEGSVFLRREEQQIPQLRKINLKEI
jgi:hypothetical protein